MKIAILAPPYLPIPPVGYGGVERIVYYLTEGLVKKGHDVTLFAPGDSKVSSQVFSTFLTSLGNSGEIKNKPYLPLLQYIDCFKKASEFDLVHNHAEHMAMFFADLVATPVIHTLHSTLVEGETLEEKREVLQRFKNHNFVSISSNQREGFRELNFAATVYNGIDINKYSYIEKPRGDYLLWVGRITRKKGPLAAITVAKKLSMPLVIAAAVDPVEKPFFEEEIKPQIDGKIISFVGELHGESLSKLYGNALCTLFPITWHEPFGLVMVESMACGTPVVAYRMGSTSEVVEDRVTGFIVDDSGQMVEAVKNIDKIDRKKCRERVVEKFSVEKMVNQYEEIYFKLIKKS